MDVFLTGLLEKSTFPVVTALVLGLMTAVSPCPLATNITAIGYISKDIENRNKVFLNGLIYTLGRAVSYTLLALIIFLGADQFSVSGIFQSQSEKIIGPALILIGLFMLGIIKIRLPEFGNFTRRFQEKGFKNYFNVFLLGVFFALTFCPYSGVLYFGMLMPVTLGSTTGMFLPVVFAVATGVPVLIFTWLIAYAVSEVGKMYNRLQIIEKWFRQFVAFLFIGTGIYYIILVYL